MLEIFLYDSGNDIGPDVTILPEYTKKYKELGIL
jgi:hypothetical protein